MADVVILEVTRGGKDPDSYCHVITVDLADQLDNNDPLRDLDVEDERVLATFLNDESAAREWCAINGKTVEADVFEAVGY